MRLPWMNRSDRARWRWARSFADLAGLTALWLEGAIGSRPGYTPRYGPDPETEHLIPVLVAANWSGFLTEQSQPGLVAIEDGDLTEQRAAVCGFVTDPALLQQLLDTARTAGLLATVHGMTPGRDADGHVVTRCNGYPYTTFGGYIAYRDLRTIWPPRHIGDSAFNAVSSAWQVTLVDPQYGRDDRLWPALATAIGHELPAAASDHKAPVSA